VGTLAGPTNLAGAVMRVLVVGGGGREHALAAALARSPSVREVLVAPGNPGIAREARCRVVPVGATDLDGLLRLAQSERVDLTVVGPEAPLVAGIADRFRAAGLRILGPGAEAARLEGSKAFAKRVMAEAGVPTAAFGVHDDLESALAALPAGPVVVKADGLAAGKGVVVAADRAEAEAAVREMLGARRFGEAGARVVLEERLSGEEVSVIALCDGERAVCFPPAQDHKRVGEGDTGPNTGGMGAYAPAPMLDAAALDAVRTKVIEPVLAVMRRRGTPFVGFLYAGLMLTPDGPKVLEFNARLGDPEAQVLLALTDGDLARAFATAAAGHLEPGLLTFRPGAAACVVLAAAGYPGEPRTGDPLTGLDAAAAVPGVQVLHAGTREVDGRLVTAGGRVLGVTATASGLRDALAACYAAVARIHADGLHFRRDIGHRAR
jgi:phosphoribosylamine--glycine ligase